MRQIPATASLITYVDELEYTEAALRADPATADLAPVYHSTIGEWGDLFHKQRAARREITRAEAVVAVRNGQLDATTRKFAGRVLVEADNDRTSSFFRRFFSVAPSEFIRQNLRAQSERTRDVMVPEIEKLGSTSALAAFVEPLSNGAKAALTALTARTKAKGEAAMTASDIDEWKEGVNQLRRSTHAELLKRAVEQKQARDWPELFFRTASGPGTSEEDAPVDPTPAPPV